MGWIKGRGHSGTGMTPEPPPFTPPVVRDGWVPFAANATPNTQVGAYAMPPRTQYPTNLPDRQLNCGVNGLSRYYNVATPHGTDVPYFQMTQFPQNPRHLIQSGQRSGGVQPMGVMSSSFVPRAYAQAYQQAALQAGVLGW